MKPSALAVPVLLLIASSASAQWMPVAGVPDANIYSVFTKGDTIAVASDSTVFVSVDAGGTWTPSATVAPGVTTVEAVRIHRGRLYAGTFGQGVFVSDDLGATWQSFNSGLVGGFADSQLRVMDLLARGDTLYGGTAGAGVWIRNLASGGWSHYGNVLEPSQASSVEALAASSTRLFAASGVNGDVYFRGLGDPDWSFDYLLGDVAAGLASQSATWTGNSWLVGTNIGVFRSTTGQSPWTYTDFGLHPTFFSSFALRGGMVFTSFANGQGTGIEYSLDDGASWQLLDALPAIFTYEIAANGDQLYAGRVDGLWRRSIANVAVPAIVQAPSLQFSVAGAHPARGDARFRIVLPEAGAVRVTIFDPAGRRLGAGVDALLPAGESEVTWRTGDLAAGVYLARLEAAGRTATLRLVHLR